MQTWSCYKHQITKRLLKQIATCMSYACTIFPSVKLDCYFNNKRDKAAFLVIDDADNFKRVCRVLPFLKSNFEHKNPIIYNLYGGGGMLFIHMSI